MRGEVPTIDPSLRVPFSKAALRREGSDVTIVSWGRAVGTCMAAAKELDAKGIEAEIWDLRTLVPPDLESVFKSVSKTGRLVVASEDRAFAGFVRSIQGAVVEKFPGVPTMALGQKNIPGIAQSLILEDATILSKQDVYEAVETLCNTKANTGSSGWSFIPPRYFIS